MQLNLGVTKLVLFLQQYAKLYRNDMTYAGIRNSENAKQSLFKQNDNFSIIFSEIRLPTRVRKKISDMEIWGLSNSTCFVWSPSDSKRILGVTTANKIKENNKELCQ